MSARVNEISGIVVPARWDEDGNVTGTAIHTFDENEYTIEYDRSGDLFKSLIHQAVIVSGKVRQRLDGKKLIRVISVKSAFHENDRKALNGIFDKRAR